MTFPSKVQPAGGCFELQTLYGACRVFVLKSSKSQDILVKIGCFTQNGDLSNTHTPIPAHIHKFKFGFLHFGAVVRFVQFRVCCTCTIRYHQYMLKACPLLGGVQGCIVPNSLIYKKSPPNCCLRAKEVWKIGNFYVFLDKEMVQNSWKVLFCQICTLWGKKNSTIFAKCPHSENQEEIHFWKICTLLRRKSLVWAWLKQVKCIGLGSKGA